LLVLNDELRQVLAQTPKLDILRREARKHGFRGLQEEGILLVAKGVTSLAELQRVLKE
jgi:type II secretory ATPase GspE/PulE/Tfp pilus assembly ATPase PilB-like protein